ncbi:MAG: hypothetical protein IJD28_03760 [Deferribacterales bacterium]|nr:hypothetical protein [Deferribacterales bacterium]
MEERIYARYMSDVAYFLTKLEAAPESYYFIPIALAYNKLKKYDETISLCKIGLSYFPSNCGAKVLLAEASIYTGDTDFARELLFDVLTEDGDNYKALKLLGVIYRSLEMNDEALKYFTGAYLRSPEDIELKKTIEDMGGSVDIDDILGSIQGSHTVSEGEEDEEAKTFQEIELKIKNAELVMADLVADKTIMGPKRSKDEAEKEPESNLISDDELELLLMQASEPVKAEPLPQEEIAPPESVFIDDDLAKLMSGQDLAQDENISGEEDLSFNEGDTFGSDLPNDDSQLLDEPLSFSESDLLSEDLPIDGNVSENMDLSSHITDEPVSLDDMSDDDLLAALRAKESASVESVAASSDDDLLSALGSENLEEILGQTQSENDDLLSALGSENLEEALEQTQSENDDLLSALGSENLEEILEQTQSENDDLLSALGSENLEEAPLLKDPQDLTFEMADMIGDDTDNERDDNIYPQSSFNELPPEGDLGSSAPFVQDNIWNEILEASGLDGADRDKGEALGEESDSYNDTVEFSPYSEDNPPAKTKKQRQLEKLEAKLNKIRKRTEK